MPGLAAKLALSLGFDTLLQWVLRTLMALVVIGLLVTLIVVQTVAGLLTGGRIGGVAGTVAPVVGGTPIALPVPNPEPPHSVDLGTAIVELAQMWIGVPYLLGGCTRAGVDCSCFVQNVYTAAGIPLPRVAVDQFNATVSVTDPQPGDLVFFANTYQPGISHVGIYIGNGLQINAPTTGQFVSVAPVFTGYWGAHYVGAHRVRA